MELVGDLAQRFGGQEQPVPERVVGIGVACLQRRRQVGQCGVETASASSLPSRMNGSADAIVEKQKSTRPVITSVSTSGMPRNGTCTPSNLALKRKRSVVKCVDEPTPAVPKVIAPFFAWAAATICRPSQRL